MKKFETCYKEKVEGNMKIKFFRSHPKHGYVYVKDKQTGFYFRNHSRSYSVFNTFHQWIAEVDSLKLAKQLLKTFRLPKQLEID